MIRTMLEGDYQHAELRHLRMDLSDRAEVVSRFAWGKLWRLGRLILRTWGLRWREGARVLYYPPAGRECWALWRDVVYLLSVRCLFARTVYHFHAAGFRDRVEGLPVILRVLVLWAYGRPDAVIRVARGAPDAGPLLRARQSLVVRNGVDIPGAVDGKNTGTGAGGPRQILFLGRLCEAKGLDVLLEACAGLEVEGLSLMLAGDWDSPEYEAQVRERVSALGLQGVVRFAGRLESAEKWRCLRETTVFCLPSHYPDEVLPVAIIEAMASGLPVVATRWGCIPELVEDGLSGLLVPPGDAGALARALQKCLNDPALAVSMGERGRVRYAEGLTAEAYRAGLDRVFAEL